jgi:biopolymer transport protein ExbB
MTANIITLLELGGPVAMVLVLMSVIATALVVFKVVQFFRAGVGKHKVALGAIELWSTGRRADAQQAAGADQTPVSRVIAHAFDMIKQSSHSMEAAKEDVLRIALDEIREMKSYLRGIEVIAQTAPLLGLLGTVVGMIEAFNKLESSGAAVNPAQLAGGIWTALLATALGLIVAIIFSVIGAWFEARVERERSVMESLLTRLFAREAMGMA